MDTKRDPTYLEGRPSSVQKDTDQHLRTEKEIFKGIMENVSKTRLRPGTSPISNSWNWKTSGPVLSKVPSQLPLVTPATQNTDLEPLTSSKSQGTKSSQHFRWASEQI